MFETSFTFNSNGRFAVLPGDNSALSNEANCKVSELKLFYK